MTEAEQPTQDQLEAVLHENLEGWKQYQAARGAGDADAQDYHRVAYQAYSRAARLRRKLYPRETKA